MFYYSKICPSFSSTCTPDAWPSAELFLNIIKWTHSHRHWWAAHHIPHTSVSRLWKRNLVRFFREPLRVYLKMVKNTSFQWQTFKIVIVDFCKCLEYSENVPPPTTSDSAHLVFSPDQETFGFIGRMLISWKKVVFLVARAECKCLCSHEL